MKIAYEQFYYLRPCVLFHCEEKYCQKVIEQSHSHKRFLISLKKICASKYIAWTFRMFHSYIILQIIIIGWQGIRIMTQLNFSGTSLKNLFILILAWTTWRYCVGKLQPKANYSNDESDHQTPESSLQNIFRKRNCESVKLSNVPTSQICTSSIFSSSWR